MTAAFALELDDVSAGYGETVVLEKVKLALEDGETLSIIGRNGVGKTTLVATIMGHTSLHGGRLRLHGKDLGLSPPIAAPWPGSAMCPRSGRFFLR